MVHTQESHSKLSLTYMFQFIIFKFLFCCIFCQNIFGPQMDWSKLRLTLKYKPKERSSNLD